MFLRLPMGSFQDTERSHSSPPVARIVSSVFKATWRLSLALVPCLSFLGTFVPDAVHGVYVHSSAAVLPALQFYGQSQISMVRPAFLDTHKHSLSSFFHKFSISGPSRYSVPTGKPSSSLASNCGPSVPAVLWSVLPSTSGCLACETEGPRALSTWANQLPIGQHIERGLTPATYLSAPFAQQFCTRLRTNPRISTLCGKKDAMAATNTVESGTTRCEKKPKIVFVLGGPGAGKGTQCELLTKHHRVFHISAGDCLREERQRPNSKDGELIQECIREGRIVPVEITLTLLLKKMLARGWSEVFLIDGFPRNQDNLDGWLSFTKRENLIKKLEQISTTDPELAPQCKQVLEQLQAEGKTAADGAENASEANGSCADNDSGVEICFCLFLDCSEETMEARLLERGKHSGRADDNAAAIKKRFRTYKEETMPIVQYFEKHNKVKAIDAGQTVEQVWSRVDQLFKNL
ncbi:UNVERIFIED_CONTAM: UMP-CMP kinase [Hammondia hammondi]|eukprot:XP_008883213.1 UMP-CMP kinase [Hammondia hammondi]